MNPTIDQTLAQAIEAHRSGRLQDAERLYRAILQAHPGHPDANHNLGVLAAGAGKPEEALPYLRTALESDPAQGQLWISYITGLVEAGRFAEAGQTLAEARRRGLPRDAAASLEQRLGEQRQGPSQQEIDAVLSSFNAADLERAEALARALIGKFPDHAFGWKALGVIAQETGDLEKSLAPMQRAVELDPRDAEAHANLGATLHELGRLTEAEASYREAIRRNPDHAEAHYNLGVALSDLGRMAEAEASYREAMRLKPDYAAALSALLFSLNYVESLSPEAALAAAQGYGVLVSARAEPKFTSWRAGADPSRLRVGLVSGDLRSHPVGYFAEGLVNGLDRQQFELVGFPTAANADDLTNRIRAGCEGWSPLHGKGDAEAAAIIHQQGIQVLIDLSGHTSGNRLPVFSYRPAPVQACWLGYFATTGLPEMDYFLGDPWMCPESERSHFTETVWTLPDTWLSLTPPERPIPIGPLPALTNGHATFGCFGNLSKMNDEVVRLWSAVLGQAPGSTLLLKSRQLADPDVMAEVRGRFAAHGLDDDRLLLEGPASRSAYLEAYNRIDMVLDTFPYPGGTTSVDALWMGAPVLTLKGDRFLSHLGESIAHNAGQSVWIAQDRGDYVRKAVRFASDLQGLASLRGGLRDRVLKSPLFDTRRFAEHFGDALWSMWRGKQGRPSKP